MKKFLLFILIFILSATSIFSLSACLEETDNDGGEKESFNLPSSIILVEDYDIKTNLIIECEENLLFNKHNVRVNIDKTYVGTLKHGTRKVCELYINEGKHTLFLEAEGDSGYKGNIDFYAGAGNIFIDIKCDWEEILLERKIQMPWPNTNYLGKNYNEVKTEFTKLGFTNISLIPVKCYEQNKNNQVVEIRADGSLFQAADTYTKDTPITIKYNKYIETLTEENSVDFANLLNKEISINNFYSKHYGKHIKFNGCVSYLENYKDYTTRFNFYFAGGEYNSSSHLKSVFIIENARFGELAPVGTDTIAEGMNFEILAKMEGIDSSGDFIIIEIISMEIIYKYDKAFIREMSNYDCYYMFDEDSKEVVYFSSNNSSVLKGVYSGNFSTGVTINYGDGWTEKFTCSDSINATLLDANGYSWSYKSCGLEKAQNVLNSVMYG